MFHMKATFGFPKWNSPEMEHIFFSAALSRHDPVSAGCQRTPRWSTSPIRRGIGHSDVTRSSRTDQRKPRVSMQCEVLESVCFALSSSPSQRPLPSPLSTWIGHFADMCRVGEVARRLRPSPAGQNGISPRVGSNTRGWREREREVIRGFVALPSSLRQCDGEGASDALT